jgi:hypothetical protein
MSRRTSSILDGGDSRRAANEAMPSPGPERFDYYSDRESFARPGRTLQEHSLAISVENAINDLPGDRPLVICQRL